MAANEKQWAADPKLVQRRLATLVRLLEAEASLIGKQGRLAPVRPTELDANEMRQWARQIHNLQNASVAKPIEQMTDEELLS